MADRYETIVRDVEAMKAARELKIAISDNAYPAADGTADIDNHAIPLIALTLRDFANRAVAAALREPDAWWPIDTAPKDGTQILTWGRLHDDGGIDMGEQPRVRVSNWSPTYDCWYSACSGSHAPIFWRPLPAPPPDTGTSQG